MGGLVVLFLLGLYLLIACIVASRAKPKWGKVLAVVIFALIPTADAIYGRVKLSQLCERDGGLRTNRIVERVEGFYYGELMPDDQFIVKLGYKFVESRSLGDGYIRKERNSTGEVVLHKNVERKSAFGLGFFNDDLGKTYRYDQLYIYDLATNEKLATLTNITFRGGWAERFIAGLYASTPNSEGCGIANFGSMSLLRLVLKN
jgi:hypothetical protein